MAHVPQRLPRLVNRVLLAIPLTLLALARLAGETAAHPALSTHSAAPASGNILGPTVDISLPNFRPK